MARVLKAGLSLPNPVTNGGGTIVSTSTPKLYPIQGVPRGVNSSSGDTLKRARTARVRVSQALQRFKTTQDPQAFTAARSTIEALGRALAHGLRVIQEHAPDTADTVRYTIRNGMPHLRDASVKFRQGDYQGATASLDSALEQYDEALHVLQRTVYAVKR